MVLKVQAHHPRDEIGDLWWTTRSWEVCWIVEGLKTCGGLQGHRVLGIQHCKRRLMFFMAEGFLSLPSLRAKLYFIIDSTLLDLFAPDRFWA